MVWNIKLKCKCGFIMISSPSWTNITPTKQVGCTWSLQWQDPEEQSQSKMPMMTLDFLSWTRLRWMLKSVCGGQCYLVADRISTTLPLVTSAFSTATCEPVVNADKQAKLTVGSLRICLFTRHPYSCRYTRALHCTFECVVIHHCLFSVSERCYRQQYKSVFVVELSSPSNPSDVLLLLGKLPRQRDLSWSVRQAYITTNLCLSCVSCHVVTL